MDYKRNLRYFGAINWKFAMIAIVVGLIFLAASPLVGILIIAGAAAYIYFKVNGVPTDEEIDAIVRKQADLAVQRGYDKLGIDPDEVSLIDPIVIYGPHFGKIRHPYEIKKGKDRNYRSSNNEIIVFFFSEQQVFFYNYKFSIINEEINEGTDEYFYRDVVSVSTVTETRTETTDTKGKQDNEETFNVEYFKLTTTGGTSMRCAIRDSESAESQIRGMRNLLREKKSA